MIRIITNSLGTGDWVVVMKEDKVLYEGHSPSVYELAAMFEGLGMSAGVEELTNQQMEEGAY